MADTSSVLRRSEIRHFLSDQRMAFGVEYQAFKIWMAIAMILGIGSIQIGSYWIGGFSVVIMISALIFLRNLSAEDSFARKKYMRYMRQADVYEPWPQIRAEGISGNIHSRPLGFGRNRLV